MKKKWARQKFEVYINKQKVLDGFFSSMYNRKAGERKPVIAYGNGSFPTHGRGELSVPTKYIKKKCKQFYTTEEVSEFRTSIVCPRCDKLLRKVMIKSKVKVKVKDEDTGEYTDEDKEVIRQIRGLRRCGSNVCSRMPFLNRDDVGARNILRCVTSDKRPKSLVRVPGRGKAKVLPFNYWSK